MKAVATIQSFYRLRYSLHQLSKMNTSTIANSSPNSNSLQQLDQRVFEFSLNVIDCDGDIQNLTAAFHSFPSAEDWQEWLSGWSGIGYSLLGSPQLINLI